MGAGGGTRGMLAAFLCCFLGAFDSRASCTVSSHTWQGAGSAVPQVVPRLRAAFAPVEAAGLTRGGVAWWRPRLGRQKPSRRFDVAPTSVVGLRAKDDSGDLRDEFQQLLGKSGRDRGMREMKAPKGSLEWLKQQQNAKSAQNAASPTPSTASPVRPEESAGSCDESSTGPSLVGPPAVKPRVDVPAPTYQDLDALLSGKTPSAQPTAALSPEVIAPAARPAYAVDSVADSSVVALASFGKGDSVPESIWDALTDGEGQSLSLSALADNGGDLVLVVPESAHHTGAPAETWTQLLIELQNTLGSQPPGVKAVAISPESNDVHAKMMTRYNLKLFHFASDSERAFLAAHKLWDPKAAQQGVSVERQTFIIDTATKKFAHVFLSVPAVGHAVAVRDVLQQLQTQKFSAEASAPALKAPPPKPIAPQEPASPAPGVVDGSAGDEADSAGAPAPALLQAPAGRVAAQGEGEEQMKAMDPEEAFVLSVPTVGPLIGRGGKRVKELVAASGARIRFENEPCPTMFARGTPEQRGKAFRIVSEWIASSGTERVAVPLEFHGRIIGSGGARVREIEACTRAHVLFEVEPEACMVVKGNATERAAAIAMAQEFLQELRDNEVGEEKLLLRGVDGRVHLRAVLGVKGSFIKEVEGTAHVKVRYDFKEEVEEKCLLIVGTAANRKTAVGMVEKHLVGIGEVSEHLLDEDEVRSLKGFKGKVVNRLEEESGAIISMEKDETREDGSHIMTIRGLPEQREKAWSMAQYVLENEGVHTYEIPLQLRRIVVGPNGTQVKRVEAATGAGVTLLSDKSNSSRILLRGPKESRDAAWELIQEIVYTETSEETIMVDRRTAVELLRNKARRCRELELSTGTYISVGKNSDRSTSEEDDEKSMEVVVRGLPQDRENVKAALAAIQSQGPERVLLADLAADDCKVSILDVRRIIGPRGVRVTEMEEKTGASIRLEVEPEPYVSVMGTREQKDAALDVIRTLLNQDDQEVVPLAEELHGAVIGVSGRSVQMIEQKSGAQVSFRGGADAVMVLRGDVEQRALAKQLAQELVSTDTSEHIVVREDQASALIGARGKTIRELECTTGARVQVLTKVYPNTGAIKTSALDIEKLMSELQDDEALVVIKGSEEQRKRARETIETLVEPDQGEEMTISEQQADLLLALRGALRREIEDSTGARLELTESAGGLTIIGKDASRNAARDLLAKEFEMEVETREIGGRFPLLLMRLIIGIGGVNVRRLEQEAGARIHFEVQGDNRDPTARVELRVRGTVEARAKAFELIESTQAEFAEERMPVPFKKHFVLIGRGGEVIKTLESSSNTAICFTQEPEPAMVVLGREEDRKTAFELAQRRLEGVITSDQEVILVPKELHAEVIGTGGRNIQSIERRSGALVHFKGDDTDDCVITGTAEQRDEARKLIQDTVDASAVDRLPVAKEQHRMLIGPRGSTIQDLERESGARLSFEDYPTPCIIIRGNQDARTRATQLVEQVLADDKEEHFYVERRYHGWLIGPRGSRIREIEDASGTRVTMSREEPVVIVEGSRARREKAWEMIQLQMDMMDETGPSDGDGGGDDEGGE